MNNSYFQGIRHTSEEHCPSSIKGQEAVPDLLLYTTSGCHLCEQAERLIQQQTIAFRAVEIADDAQLLEEYGVRIPVLRRRETGQELSWPFDADALQRWLALAAR